MMWRSLAARGRHTVWGRGGGRGKASVTTSPAPHRGARAVGLGGVFPPMPTPFLPDQTIAWDHLATNVRAWSDVPFRAPYRRGHGYGASHSDPYKLISGTRDSNLGSAHQGIPWVVEGSNGEYVYLSPEERVELVQRVRDFLPSDSDKLVLAGSGCESTRDTIVMSQRMAEAGADAVMVVTPSYYKAAMKDKALHAHFTAVADNCPVPVILYSVPAFTVIDLSLDVIIDLAHHPNIIGLKESGGDITKIGSVVHQTQHLDFQVLAGSASFLLATLQIGGVGGVCAVANVLGEAVCELQRLCKEGRMEEAVTLQRKLIAPNTAVTKTFGIPGLKQVMDWKGLYGGPCRLPLQPLSTQETDNLRQVFLDAGYL
ncbi:4-hydroxy-2-oxoglutarate aldolase, mitochondrial [Chionoecetes opilio]|uniref:4-hydroxy-2-oxoglutarate aldolase, mitochondrial n=1 Tax=Chionoecetes opilio TaxID=41210 RepID=A0A8J4Y5T1_CHIOP|nr:4-hydroxy-2-oxoglutarate aldolase, mitochondrial [Chionoecetes opilio]